MGRVRSPQDVYRRELEALRSAYLAEVPERLRAIEELEARLPPRGKDEESLQALHHLIHRLAGSAAVYGLSALGATAGRLEASVLRALEAVDGSNGETRSEIESR